jgi:hypothetical protein
MIVHFNLLVCALVGDVDFVDKSQTQRVFFTMDSHEFKKELISPLRYSLAIQIGPY